MNRIFFLFLFIFIFFSVKSEKLFRLVDLLDKDSYIPIRQGEVFIIEVEGNPSQNRVWSVEDPKTLISRDLIFPLNLDEHDSCTFYISETKSNFANGIYHFRFITSKRNLGHEEITFVFKTVNQRIQKTINIHIINQPKIDL